MQLLQHFLRPVLARNDRFKGRHKGETCYIFGNGASLKNMDLSAFSDHVSIGLNLLCLHNDFRALNIPYYLCLAPFFAYPYFKNPYTNKIQENPLGVMFKKAVSKHSDVAKFVNVSNIFGYGLKNFFYLHHLGHRHPDKSFCDIGGAFSFMKSGLSGGIGLAVSMGFKKAILVGCDYTFTPCKEGHFYAAGPPVISNRYENVNEKLFEETAGLIDLVVITDTGESQWLPHQSYESYTGRKIKYRENAEIVSSDYLNSLQRVVELKQYHGIIFP